MIASLRALCALLICATTTLAQYEFDEPKKDQVEPSLIAGTTAVVPGKPFTVLVKMKMKEGWHAYWQFAGDTGFAPKANWELPGGFTADPIQWPLPTKHYDKEADQTTYTYENEVLLPVEITPPATISATQVDLKASLSWLVCEKECIPGNADVSLSLPVAASASEANADLLTKARGQLPKADAPPFSTQWTVKPEAFTVAVSGLSKDVSVEFFPLPSKGAIPGVAKVSDAGAEGARTITVPVKSGGAADTPWQGLIVTKSADGTRAGWMISSSSSISTPKTVEPKEAKASASQSDGEDRSLLGWLGMAFLGGLILNLMPCVLPVISLKIFGFVSQAGQEPKRIFRLGLAFVAGVFVFFLALAFVAIGLQATGKEFYWGMQFADPRLFVPLISIVVVFALSMFGVFEITLGGTTENALGKAASHEGYGGAFVHGLFTTLLGTSCTAPVMGAAIGFAVTQPPLVIIVMFALLAAGMSLPYFLLTWHPAWLKFLPKPGMWMERFKQTMGFVLLAAAVWLLGTIGQPAPMAATAWFLTFLAFGVWIYGAGGRKLWALGAAIVVIAIGGKFFLPTALTRTKATASEATVNEVGILWETFSEERLKSATAKGEAVFIDFTADWCANCKANEALVLNTSTVANAFKARNVLTLKADWTHFDKEIGKWIKSYKRAGVPVYVLYRPGESRPVILPEALTQQTVIDELSKISTAKE